jgi:hypothetical protein
MHQPRPGPSAGETRVRAGPILRAAVLGAVPDAGRMDVQLIVLAGPQAGQRFAVGRSQTFGRGRAATIRLHESEVSRLHARIYAADGSARLEDLGSKNGVLLNGARLRARWSNLEPGDEITIGSTTMALTTSAGHFGQSECTEAGAAEVPRRTDRMRSCVRRLLGRAGPAGAAAVALMAAAVCLGVAAARMGLSPVP